MPPSSILDTLFPPTCLLCGAPGSRDLDLCDGCVEGLPWNRHCCARCALPFDGAELDGALCGACQRRAPPYERCFAALRYETPVPNLVGAAKFRGRMNAVRLLGQLLARSVQAAGQPLPEVLVPVPLHRRRLAERGYNQALEIARVVGRQLELPLEPGCCDRGVATLPRRGWTRAPGGVTFAVPSGPAHPWACATWPSSTTWSPPAARWRSLPGS